MQRYRGSWDMKLGVKLGPKLGCKSCSGARFTAQLGTNFEKGPRFEPPTLRSWWLLWNPLMPQMFGVTFHRGLQACFDPWILCVILITQLQHNDHLQYSNTLQLMPESKETTVLKPAPNQPKRLSPPDIYVSLGHVPSSPKFVTPTGILKYYLAGISPLLVEIRIPSRRLAAEVIGELQYSTFLPGRYHIQVKAHSRLYWRLLCLRRPSTLWHPLNAKHTL